ncbi:MAG TPA: MmcQ/YjbR family DNA-binding protein [Longimicrobium sp.]|nr:MmcQ/YjbR family DNA-binding protein [Longimicrobium sp.]
MDSVKDVLLDFCRSLPGATEDVKWGDHLVFSVGEKMFAMFDVGESDIVRFKVAEGLFPILTREAGISPAPYLARQSWIRLEHTRVLPREQIQDLLRESHELVASKLTRRLRRELGIEPDPPRR